jgi:hypothetical protein
VESRDSAAQLAFRQMATAWARLAVSEAFTSPAVDENAASSPAGREKEASNPATEDVRNLLDHGKLIDCG